MELDPFIVTRRAGGQILAEGTVTRSGEVTFSSFGLEESQRLAVSKQISDDIKNGYHGGALDAAGLEWMVMLRNPNTPASEG